MQLVRAFPENRRVDPYAPTVVGLVLIPAIGWQLWSLLANAGDLTRGMLMAMVLTPLVSLWLCGEWLRYRNSRQAHEDQERE